MRRIGPLYLYLMAALFLLGLLLVAVGVDLDRVDLWLDRQAGWLEIVGSWLFRLLCAAILALCLFTVIGGLWQRLVAPRRHLGDAVDFADAAMAAADGDGAEIDESRPVGWGAIAIAAVVGYFAWFGVVG